MSNKIVKAYSNRDFLNSHGARPIRVQCELVEPELRLAEEGIEARLAAADKDAALLAQQDAEELMGIQGDINNFEERTKSVIEITSNQDKPE